MPTLALIILVIPSTMRFRSAVKKSVVNLALVVASRIFADGTALSVEDLFFFLKANSNLEF